MFVITENIMKRPVQFPSYYAKRNPELQLCPVQTSVSMSR